MAARNPSLHDDEQPPVNYPEELPSTQIDLLRDENRRISGENRELESKLRRLENKVDELTSANKSLDRLVSELQSPETYRKNADERRRADLGFISQLLDRLGLDTNALKIVGMAVMKRFGNSTDHAELDSIATMARLQGRHEVADRALQVKIDDLAKRLGVLVIDAK